MKISQPGRKVIVKKKKKTYMMSFDQIPETGWVPTFQKLVKMASKRILLEFIHTRTQTECETISSLNWVQRVYDLGMKYFSRTLGTSHYGDALGPR